MTLPTGSIDPHRLNEARWAACNARDVWGENVTMEQATVVADEVVRCYLGLSPEEWDEMPKEQSLTKSPRQTAT